MSDKDKNRLYQKRWYERQKQQGNIVYLLTLVSGGTYVGSTTSSIKKRFWQHRAADSTLVRMGYDLTGAKIEVLEDVGYKDELKEKEQHWINKLNPTINQLRAVAKDYQPSEKRTIEFEGVTYKTKRELWKALGKTKYGTFKSRQFRHPDNISWALGTSISWNQSK